jgi:hypothetical protein
VTQTPGREFRTILCQGNGIVNVGEETRIYHGRWRNTGQKAEDIARYYYAEVALATLPRDRWGALGLNPNAASGVVCSAPFIVPTAACELRVNAGGVAGMTVDLLDERMAAIPGFTAGTVRGSDGLDCTVCWPGRGLPELASHTVRVRVTMAAKDGCQPRLYAFYVDHSRKGA